MPTPRLPSPVSRRSPPHSSLLTPHSSLSAAPTAPAPTRAILLAAGLGTRLRPLTDALPKPMLPLWGEPMILRTLRLLASWGVERVLVNLHHAPSPLVNLLASNPVPGLQIDASFEPDILGTGGVLQRASWFLPQDPGEPFWLLNGDIAAFLDPAPLLAARAAHPDDLAACWVTQTAGPRTLRLSPSGHIADYRAGARGTHTFCGLHLLDSRILPHLAPSGFDTIIDAYLRARRRHPTLRVRAVTVSDSFWADLGTPAQYVQAHHDLRSRLAPSAPSFTVPAAALFPSPERRRLYRTAPAQTVFSPVDAFPRRASERTFYRLHFPAPSPHRDPTAIAVRWSPKRPDNALYAPLSRLLAASGVPVPRLLLDAPRSHLLLLQDLGDDTLLARLRALPRRTPSALLDLYEPVLRLTLQFHALPPDALPPRVSPPFDPATARWEHAYFAEHCLANHLHLPPQKAAAVQNALSALIPPLFDSPSGVIHRDWQSTNIMYLPDGAPAMIDFQALRRGPLLYDLASLLCDPYADLPPPVQTRLCKQYLTAHPSFTSIPPKKWAAAWTAARVQRLLQALGAYARLSTLPDMSRFATYIPPALRLLRPLLRSPHLPAPLRTLLLPLFS